MAKVKKAFLLCFLMLLTILMSLSIFGGKISKAETIAENEVVYSNENDNASTLGLYTKMVFSLDGGDGQIWFTAKNQFTLFSSVVTVIVELYRSDTYQESYTDMTLVASNYIADLNQGKSITAISSTEGKQSYWKARGYYKRDSSAWVEKITETLLFNEYGIIIL